MCNIIYKTKYIYVFIYFSKISLTFSYKFCHVTLLVINFNIKNMKLKIFVINAENI